jgi:hypothetical protein
MKQFLLLILPVFFFSSVNAQRDTIIIPAREEKTTPVNKSTVNISIFPVPVRNNAFTIKSDKDISAIKITNIIGQEIYRIKYSNPILITRILLENPGRGMYLVAISFNDNTRLVKKILIEGIN